MRLEPDHLNEPANVRVVVTVVAGTLFPWLVRIAFISDILKVSRELLATILPQPLTSLPPEGLL